MSVTQEEISRVFDAMQSRSPPPRLTPEQLNAIDLLIFGKTDKEVAETIGVGRNTISKWYKNAFFIAELNARREELWKEEKLRLKSLVHEAGLCALFAVNSQRPYIPDSPHSSKDKYILPVTQSSLTSIMMQAATLRSD